MKKLSMIFVAILMMAGFSMKVMAQTNTSATVTATSAGAVLITPMHLTQTAVLHFGTIVLKDATGGTVLLPSNSTTREYTGGLEISAGVVSQIPSNAAYTVGGTRNQSYAITLPADIIVTKTAGTSATMHITELTAHVASAGADAIIGTLSDSGADNFTVGGTLTVAAAQLGGAYSGTFPVTVDYN